jgi:DNA uptake protein ComE-like DNA-binding protein
MTENHGVPGSIPGLATSEIPAKHGKRKSPGKAARTLGQQRHWVIVGYALWSNRNEDVTVIEVRARTEPGTMRVEQEQRRTVEPRPGEDTKVRSGVRQVAGENLHPSASQASRQPLVDLNHASEQELAALPSIGIILAKRAVDLRETRGGFRSVEDFGEALDLKPHKVERIRPLVSASTPVQRSQPPESPGRVVDY